MTLGLVLREVDEGDPRPKYVQAQQILIDAIRIGDLPPGMKLPATKDIGDRIHVSLITAHKALEGLVESGWLRREVGRGTYVREDVDPASGHQRPLFVGIVLEHDANIADYYHSTLIEGLRREARAEGPRVEFFLHEKFDLRDKAVKNVGAICIHPPLESQPDVEQLAQDYPVVVLGGSFPGNHVTCVDCDNHAGAREAVRHLFDLGHRRLLLLSGPLSLSNSRDRAEGAVTEMADLRLKPDLRDMLVSKDSVAVDEETRAKIRKCLSRRDRPTAIVAGGFYLALACLEIVRSAELSIPGDVSLVGFDDPAAAAMLDPPLTTVRQPLDEMAARACRLVRQAIVDGQPPTDSCTLATEMVVRGSTAAVK